MAYKYHKQFRLPGFDYSSNNAYFITICTKNRQHFFGEIANEEMYLTEIGLFVESLFQTIHSKLDYITIIEFIIMPDHVHFIGEIFVEEKVANLPPQGLQPLVKKSISSFTNHFKGKIKRWCNENNFKEFEWQPRFRDRIIRDENEYFAIKNYMINNVKNWKEDSYINWF